jgi:bifunctional DNA-binding transcriptional regulator/antitoxin component of YhaV-PrlF toxin-antitoxin module
MYFIETSARRSFTSFQVCAGGQVARTFSILTYNPIYSKIYSNRKEVGMFFTIVSPKYQMTLGMEIRKALGILPGTRLKQSVADGKVIMEPVRDIMESYGVFKNFAPAILATNQEETEAAERGMAEDAMKSMRHEWQR